LAKQDPCVAFGVRFTLNTLNTTVASAITYPTTLTTAAPAKANVSKNFTVTGTLTSGTTAIKNQTITLQRSLNNSTFVTVAGHTNTTNASGGYTLTTKETATGTYYYRGYYAGNATYAAAASKGVKVVVS
jgi:hypothetical protein